MGPRRRPARPAADHPWCPPDTDFSFNIACLIVRCLGRLSPSAASVVCWKQKACRHALILSLACIFFCASDGMRFAGT